MENPLSESMGNTNLLIFPFSRFPISIVYLHGWIESYVQAQSLWWNKMVTFNGYKLEVTVIIIPNTLDYSILVQNPYKPSFATVTGKGDNPTNTHQPECWTFTRNLTVDLTSLALRTFSSMSIRRPWGKWWTETNAAVASVKIYGYLKIRTVKHGAFAILTG